MSIRCYSELIQLPTFMDRYQYLRLDGVVGEETFGFDRYMNQAFYKSPEWRRVRDAVIARDLARLNPMQRQGAMTTAVPSFTT